MNEKRPVVFNYDDYRAYLSELYTFLKKDSRFFSYRYFSKVAGFSSPNILKLVMEGQRNLSKDGVKKFNKGLKHNTSEADFFTILVNFNQAKNTIEKQKAAESLMKHKAYKRFHPLTQSEFKYYTYWYYIPIRELVAAPYFKNDPVWIAKQLSPEITAQQAKEAIKELCLLGLLKKDETGKLTQSSPDVTAADAVGSTFVARFHREMLRLASESIDRFKSDQREISSSTILVSEENFNKVKSLVQKFRDDLVAITSEDPDPQMICQIGLQLFPLSKKNGAENE
ncbi:MAG: TIGR02147 family protein [Bdellovibrionaceae bacterium]|jgi:uncharacterized protein (TIGR02147 family)|nr:TIGR02147 family protein [Pseudobdellovibrionaceae bacterium]